MKKLSLLILYTLFATIGCTVMDPEIPDGTNSYKKGGIPKARASVWKLSQYRASLQVVIESTGERKLTKFRLCYSKTNPLPDTTDYVLDAFAQYVPGADTTFVTLSGLELATNYYCRVYLANSNNDAYTSSMAFITRGTSSDFSWKQVSPLPLADQFYFAALTLNNRAFVFSSYNDWTSEEGGVMQEYLPASNMWKRRADLPWKNKHLPWSMVIEDKAYVGFGDICERHPDGFTLYYGQRTDWWCYDPATDHWTRKADIPARTASVMTTFGVGGKGYVLVSDDFEDSTPMRVFQYDPLKDEWSRKRDFPGRKLQHPASFVIGNRPFVFTGITDKEGDDNDGFQIECTTYVWEYEVKTDTWLRRSDFNGGGRDWMVATALDGIGYAGFGSKLISENYFGDAIDWWVYYPDIDKWEQRSVFREWSNFFPYFAFAIDGSVYVGSTNQGVWKYLGEGSEE